MVPSCKPMTELQATQLYLNAVGILAYEIDSSDMEITITVRREKCAKVVTDMIWTFEPNGRLVRIS